MKKTLTAILPDGRVVTRTTARTYTHVVALSVTNCPWGNDDSWGVVGWCGSLELAQKRVNSENNTIRRNSFYDNAELAFDIVEVQS